jgi:hypothetical protein
MTTIRNLIRWLREPIQPGQDRREAEDAAMLWGLGFGLGVMAMMVLAILILWVKP